MKSDVEHWKPVVGYEGLYEVSDLGRVRSLYNKRTRLGGGILCQGWCKSYPMVSLRKNKKSRTHTVHPLVLTAFVGPRPDGLQGCHNNGEATDNRLKNLRWDTRAANFADMARHGSRIGVVRGAKNPKAKLNDAVIPVIRQRRKAGEQLWAIARDYGVNDRSIAMICLGQTWRHVL